MHKKELTKYLPERGAGLEGIKRLSEIGYPVIQPVTKSLLSHLERTPFPATETDSEISKLLGSAGNYIVDEVATALQENRSPQKKYILLSLILPNWTTEQLKPLEEIIYGFIEGYSFHGLDVWALKLMLEKRLAGHQSPLEWLQFKTGVYEQKLKVLKEINLP